MKQRLSVFFILLIAILAISIFYHYPSLMQMLPQGSHIWRQADCMAMTQNYSEYNLSFFHPANYNLQSTNGNVAGEFPLFYYIAAQFKSPAFALRFMHSIIFLAGILATYFIAFYFLQRRLLATYCCILMFTSPLLVFYGNNFLSDVPALSFAFIAWAFFLNAYKKEKIFWIIIAFCCFTLAALLKASEAINLAIVFIFLFKFRKKHGKQTIFFSSILISLISFLVFFSWYFYAKQYNLKNHDTYYFLNVFPIWKLSLYDIGLGIWRMVISNSNNYFWRPTSIFLILSFYFLIKNRKKINPDLSFILTASFGFTILYIIFFYQKMIGHEYYYVPFFIFALFAIISLSKVYNYFYAENVFSHTFIFLCLLLNIIYCRNFVLEKLKIPLYNGYLASTNMQVFLENKGVTKDKSIISLPDDTPNKTLYLLKRKGYTAFNNYKSILKNKKADFLLADKNFMEQHKTLTPYLADSIGNFNEFVLYKLK